MLQEYFGKLFPCKKVSVHPCRRRTARRGASPKAASVGPTNSSLSWAETSAAKPRHNTRELSHWETDSGFQARLKDTETLKEIHLSHWKLIFPPKKEFWLGFGSKGGATVTAATPRLSADFPYFLQLTWPYFFLEYWHFQMSCLGVSSPLFNFTEVCHDLHRCHVSFVTFNLKC